MNLHEQKAVAFLNMTPAEVAEVFAAKRQSLADRIEAAETAYNYASDASLKASDEHNDARQKLSREIGKRETKLIEEGYVPFREFELDPGKYGGARVFNDDHIKAGEDVKAAHKRMLELRVEMKEKSDQKDFAKQQLQQLLDAAIEHFNRVAPFML